MKYQPRNDFVLLRVVERTLVRGIAMPQRSQQGRDLFVEAVGPQVEGLSIGAKVLAIGKQGQDVIEVPNESKLLLTRQQNVVVVIEGEEGD